MEREAGPGPGVARGRSPGGTGRGARHARPGPDIEVAGEAGSGDEAVALARNGSYDVILMDLRMPGNRSRRRDRLARGGRPGDQDRGAHHA